MILVPTPREVTLTIRLVEASIFVSWVVTFWQAVLVSDPSEKFGDL